MLAPNSEVSLVDERDPRRRAGRTTPGLERGSFHTAIVFGHRDAAHEVVDPLDKLVPVHAAVSVRFAGMNSERLIDSRIGAAAIDVDAITTKLVIDRDGIPQKLSLRVRRGRKSASQGG